MKSFGVSGADATKKYMEAANVFEVDLAAMEGEDVMDPRPGPSAAPPPAPAPAPAPEAGAKKRKHAEVSDESEESDSEMPSSP